MNPFKSSSGDMNIKDPYRVVKEVPRQTINNPKYRNNDHYEEDSHKKIQIAPIIDYNPPLENDQKKSKQMLQKEYDARSIRYANEEYSYQSNQLLSRFAQVESASNISTAFPLFKMLRGIVRKFMFNELEIIFFLHTIEEQKWRFDHELIVEYAPYFKQDFLSNSEIQNAEAYQRLLLFLLCCGYTIKCFFNDQNEQELLLIYEHIQSYCSRDFKKFIEQWRQKNMFGSLKIVPRVINKLYNKLIKIPRDGNQLIQQDFNALVDQIIQISPPYSSQEQKGVKQEKPQQQIQLQSQQQQQQQSALLQQSHLQIPQYSQYSLIQNNHSFQFMGQMGQSEYLENQDVNIFNLQDKKNIKEENDSNFPPAPPFIKQSSICFQNQNGK